MIRVLLVSPSPALRAGLRSLLSADDRIQVAGELSEWSDSCLEEMEAEVVITTSALRFDLDKDGPENSSRPAFLFLRDTPFSYRALTGSPLVWGILPTDVSADELCSAIHALAQGLIVGTPALLISSTEEDPVTQGPLTDRESEILSLLAKGLANKQIAVRLGISEHTVKFHVSSIYAKLNATNRTQAVREGLRNGWIAL